MATQRKPRNVVDPMPRIDLQSISTMSLVSSVTESSLGITICLIRASDSFNRMSNS